MHACLFITVCVNVVYQSYSKVMYKAKSQLCALPTFHSLLPFLFLFPFSSFLPFFFNFEIVNTSDKQNFLISKWTTIEQKTLSKNKQTKTEANILDGNYAVYIKKKKKKQTLYTSIFL